MPIVRKKADDYVGAIILFSIASLLAYSLINGDFTGSDAIFWSFIAGLFALTSLYFCFRKVPN